MAELTPGRMLELLLSREVTVCIPGVLSVTCVNRWPSVSLVVLGSTAAASLELKRMVASRSI